MTGEQEIHDDLLDRLQRIARGVRDDLIVLGEAPATLEAFNAMPLIPRTASKALLKEFEQYVDTLQRVIRTQLRVTGHRLKGMTPLDVANKAEELEQVADGPALLRLINLRNDLAHEYPDNDVTRFTRFTHALAAFDFLDDAAARVRRFAATRMPESSS